MNLSQIFNVIDNVYPLDTGLSHIFCKLFPYNKRVHVINIIYFSVPKFNFY